MISFTIWLWEIEIRWRIVEPSIDWSDIHPYMDFEIYLDGVEVLGLCPEICKQIERLCWIDKEAEDWMNADLRENLG